VGAVWTEERVGYALMRMRDVFGQVGVVDMGGKWRKMG
jgi:hypothetical protein